MISLSVDNLWFIILVLVNPILFFCLKKKQSYIFFFINLSLFSLSMHSIIEGILGFIFVCFPYLYIFLKKKFKLPLYPAIVVMVVFFIYLKGYNWILTPILSHNLIFPFEILGISYILFRCIDFMIHVESGQIGSYTFIEYLNYILSFWTIIAGPIQRFSDFKKQTLNYNEAKLEKKDALLLLNRIINGYIKILIIGVFFKNFYDYACGRLQFTGYTAISFITMFYSYPVYLYMNFSGYCDIVISTAKLAGFSLPENFNKPYLARNTIDFWNRWHISLSEWIRDYIYQPFFKYLISNPLRNFVSSAQYISIFITFLIAGIWHGTALNFIIFGLLQGIGMTISMFYRDVLKKKLGKSGYKKYSASKIVIIIETLLYFHYTCLSFLFIDINLISFIKS